MAVTKGEPDNGRHPYAGLAVFYDLVNGELVPTHRFSASLLSPTVVLTAGHCTDGADVLPTQTPISVSDAEMACPDSHSGTLVSSC